MNTFLRVFSGLCNHALQIKEVGLELRTAFNPWVTMGLQKSCKRKQETLR